MIVSEAVETLRCALSDVRLARARLTASPGDALAKSALTTSVVNLNAARLLLDAVLLSSGTDHHYSREIGLDGQR